MRATVLGGWLMLQLAADGGGTELAVKARAFAKGGGGNVYVLAITEQADRKEYSFSHWAGFWTTAALSSSGAPSARPSPPLLLVVNEPVNVESRNQHSVQELVRWEADGSLVSTGVVYEKWGPPARGSEAFRAGVARLLAGK